MKIFRSLSEISDVEPAVIAVGNFDGVHKGHQEILRRTKSAAQITGTKSAVFTFSNHPRNSLGLETAVKSILYPEDKIEIIKEFGIDYLFDIPFDERIRQTPPGEYIERILIGKFRMVEIYCGFNYRYGYRAEGDVNLLLRLGLERGFTVHVLAPYKVEDHVVSSTMIRELIEKGQVDRCSNYLGRHYGIGGEVIVGNRLGKTIGFPTSNLAIDESMVTPPNGVYITDCIYGGKRYPGVTNVGVKPTIGEYKKNVETHIFNFDKELYGKEIRVEFLQKMRAEKKFGSVEELSAQITRDCVEARAYHRRRGTFAGGGEEVDRR